MARDREKNIDMTFLSIEQAWERGIFHRDLEAHWFRWTHVLNFLKPTIESRILEAGCGVLTPLAKTLYTNRQTIHKYFGIDYGPIKPKVNFTGSFQPVFLERTDFCDVTREQVKKSLGGPATLVVSFEVLEHVHPDHAVKMLKQMKYLSSKDVDIFISTPVYDHHVGAAKNHINELTYNGLRGAIEGVGLEIVNHWGTFASQKDYKKSLSPELLSVFNKLSEYYDSNILSNIMAPLIPPEQARNVLWHLRKADRDVTTHPTPATLALIETKQHEEVGQCADMGAWKRFYNELGFVSPEWTGNAKAGE